MLLESILCEFGRICATGNALVQLETLLCKFGRICATGNAFVRQMPKKSTSFSRQPVRARMHNHHTQYYLRGFASHDNFISPLTSLCMLHDMVLALSRCLAITICSKHATQEESATGTEPSYQSERISSKWELPNCQRFFKPKVLSTY